MRQNLSRRDIIKSGILLAASSAFVSYPVIASESIESEKAGEADIKARLGSNENPYGPPESSRKAMVDAIKNGNRYPFQQISELKTAIAQRENLTPDHILMGTGSTELLGVATIAYGLNGGEFISAFPTFPVLPAYSEVYKNKWIKTDLDNEHRHDLAAMENAMTADTKLMYVCNPNNPTGTIVPSADLTSFCQRVSARVPVFIDEAYLEYIRSDQNKSMTELVKQGNKGVIVARTFSKVFGLAGMRIGYLVAHPETIKYLQRYQVGNGLTNIGGLTVAAAMAALKDQEFVKKSISKNTEAKNFCYQLFKNKGIQYIPSETSFIYFVINQDIADFLKLMNEKGVTIKTSQYKGKNYCRVSMGTMEEMKIFAQALDSVYKS
jgi:histidinol-phosphate aminotransferase